MKKIALAGVIATLPTYGWAAGSCGPALPFDFLGIFNCAPARSFSPPRPDREAVRRHAQPKPSVTPPARHHAAVKTHAPSPVPWDTRVGTPAAKQPTPKAVVTPHVQTTPPATTVAAIKPPAPMPVPTPIEIRAPVPSKPVDSGPPVIRVVPPSKPPAAESAAVVSPTPLPTIAPSQLSAAPTGVRFIIPEHDPNYIRRKYTPIMIVEPINGQQRKYFWERDGDKIDKSMQKCKDDGKTICDLELNGVKFSLTTETQCSSNVSCRILMVSNWCKAQGHHPAMSEESTKFWNCFPKPKSEN